MKIKAAGFLIITFIFVSAVYAENDKSYKYDSHGKRDPFWPLVTSMGTINDYETEYLIADLSLQGIMSGATGNIAMVNGHVVGKGDKIGQFSVIDITADEVLLIKGEQKYKLKLKKEE